MPSSTEGAPSSPNLDAESSTAASAPEVAPASSPETEKSALEQQREDAERAAAARRREQWEKEAREQAAREAELEAEAQAEREMLEYMNICKNSAIPEKKSIYGIRAAETQGRRAKA